MILCQHWLYLILVTFPVPILPNFSLMERSQLRFCSTITEKISLLFTMSDEETVKTAVISPEVHIEWITFRTLLAKKPEDSIALQHELITNEMLVTMFLNLPKIASSGLTSPVSTDSVVRSFTQVKLIKTHLWNSLTEDKLIQRISIWIQLIIIGTSTLACAVIPNV